MNEHEIAFVFDTSEEIKWKINYIVEVVGVRNIAMSDTYEGITNNDYSGIRWITIRCDECDWQEIKFQLDLHEVYA